MRYLFADLQIDTVSESVFRGTEPLQISGLNFKLLAYLLARGTETVTYDELIEGVWAPSIVNNETVTQRVRLLRVALGDTQKSTKYIRSVRGIGYQLCAEPRLAIVTSPNPKWSYKTIVAAIIIIALAGFLLITKTPPKPLSQNAASVYEKALDRASFYLDIGQLDDIQRASDLLENVALEGKSDVKWLTLKSRVLSAQVCRAGADYEQLETARNYAIQALEKLPRHIPAQHSLAYSYDCAGNTAKAIAAYKQAIEWDKENKYVGSRSALAYLLGETGQLAESLAFNFAIYNSPMREDYATLQLARNYSLLQYYDLAEYYYALSFKLYPENVFSNAAYPSFLLSRGKYEAAKDALSIALERPKHADIYWVQAELYLRENNASAGLASIRDARALKSSFAFLKTIEAITQTPANVEWLEKRRTQLMEKAENATSLLERALIEVTLNYKESATESLRLAIQSGYLDIAYLRESSIYSPLRSIEEFPALANSIQNLVAIQRAQVPEEQRLPISDE